MFDEIMGLPAHPLIVHSAVIFGPLLVAAVLAYAVVPALRSRLGWIVIALSVVAPLTLWVARWSGEAFLRKQMAAGARGEMLTKLGEHQDFGNLAAWFGTALGVLGILLVLVCTAAGKKPSTTGSQAVTYGLILLSLITAAVTAYYVFKTGHSGASIVWGS